MRASSPPTDWRDQMLAPLCALAVVAFGPPQSVGLSTAAGRRCSSLRASVVSAPTDNDRAVLQDACPTPRLQPRQVIAMTMNALHRSSWDDPRPFFGFEVLGRFLSPTHQYRQGLELTEAKATPMSLSRWLRQPHKASLLAWNEYKWEGDLTIIDDTEAYQQVSIRSSPEEQWTSVRWMLKRAEPSNDPNRQWMVEAVFVSEPDSSDEAGGLRGTEAGKNILLAPLESDEQQRLFDAFDTDRSGAIDEAEFREVISALGIPISASEVTRLLREADANADGSLCFEEFSTLLAKVPTTYLPT